MNVGVYNQARGHLPLPPPWDQAPGPSDSKFALAELKNKTGFQNCHGIISVSFKNRFKLAREKGMPTNSANFGMYDSVKGSLWNWNIYTRDYSCF